MSIKPTPTFKYERMLCAQGYTRVVGVDEAGCGALAGPVVAGAVILPFHSRIGGIRDSKLLRESQREELYTLITTRAVVWSTGSASVDEIYTLVIDDGSTDKTFDAAKNLGVDYIVKNNRSLGLAGSFSKGLEAALFLGADIIVNTD